MQQKYYIPALSFSVLLCILVLGFVYTQKTQVSKDTPQKIEQSTQPIATNNNLENPHRQEEKMVEEKTTSTSTIPTELTIPTPSWAIFEYTRSSSTQYIDDTEYYAACQKDLIKKYPQKNITHFIPITFQDITLKIPYENIEIGTNINIEPYRISKDPNEIVFGSWFFSGEGMPQDSSDPMYKCLPKPQYQYTLSAMPEEWLESAPVFSPEFTEETINGKPVTIITSNDGLYKTTYMFYVYNGYVYMLSAPPEDIQEMREIISQIEPVK
jgi:hypothetical protein